MEVHSIYCAVYDVFIITYLAVFCSHSLWFFCGISADSSHSDAWSNALLTSDAVCMYVCMYGNERGVEEGDLTSSSFEP